MIVACTPTMNRRWTWEFSKACMMSQIQKPDLWIVLDNSTTPEYDWSSSKEIPWVQYSRILGDNSIGTLRNHCLGLALAAGANTIVFWDDDDYYPPTRISSGLKALQDNPDADIAASSRMFLYLVRENVMMETGPFGPKHGTAATYTIRRRYAETHKFLDKRRGEELEFTNQWTANMVQVPAEETIVVMGHGRNTVDKSAVLRNSKVYNAKIVNDANGKMFFRARWPVPWDLFRSTFFDVRCDQPQENTPRAQSHSGDYLIRHTGGTVESDGHRA
jgi:hypothetical protein